MYITGAVAMKSAASGLGVRPDHNDMSMNPYHKGNVERKRKMEVARERKYVQRQIKMSTKLNTYMVGRQCQAVANAPVCDDFLLESTQVGWVQAGAVIDVLEVRHTAATYDDENILRVRFSRGWTSMKDRGGQKLFELIARDPAYTASELEAIKADLPMREWRHILSAVPKAEIIPNDSVDNAASVGSHTRHAKLNEAARRTPSCCSICWCCCCCVWCMDTSNSGSGSDAAG
eukprot:COSAG02_NODE_2657_length_8315_cov_11.405307_2_plen_232_part_00